MTDTTNAMYKYGFLVVTFSYILPKMYTVDALISNAIT